MDVLKQRLKLLLKIIVCAPAFYMLVIEPIVYEWEDTIIYGCCFEPAPEVDTSKEKSSGGSGLIRKAIKVTDELLEKIEKTKEATEQSRANSDNQYNTLEECLSDNTEMVEYTTRDGWCDSSYVSIAENE